MKFDLHIHTNFSDGRSSPAQVLSAAISKGMSGICITDHNNIQGALEAAKISSDKNILVIPGIEIASKSGDVLGINIKKIIPGHLSLEETVKAIHSQGGIAIVPHPFGWPSPLGFWGDKQKMRFGPDGIEAFNASVVLGYCNRRALNFSNQNNLPYTAGSDAHRAEFVGRGYLDISDKILSERDLIEAILERKAKIGGKHLRFWEVLKNADNGHSPFGLFGRFANYYTKSFKREITGKDEFAF